MAINKITPRGGVPGTTVVVTGSGFGPLEGTITLDGVPVTQITSWADNQITFVTPSGTSRDGSYDLVIVSQDLSNAFGEHFWIPAIDPFNAKIDYQLPSTEAGVFQNDDLPRRAEAAIFNRLLDMILGSGSGSGGVTIASGAPGDPDEVQVSNVTKIRFLTQSLPGEDHYVIARPNGEVFIGGITPPDTLQDKVLTGQPSKVVGRLSNGNANYDVAAPAGTQVDYITRDTNLTLVTPDGASSWAYASLGNLILKINGFDVANIDLAANFQEVNRATGQILTNYNIIGTGDPISNGIVNFTGGYLRLLTVLPTQGIDTDDFQRGQAEIILTSSALRQGFNTLQLRHEKGPEVFTAQAAVWFWDQDPAGAGTNPSVSTANLAEGVPVFKKLSGISYYGTGSTFFLTTGVVRLFNNAYEKDELPVQIDGFPGVAPINVPLTDPTVSGPSSPPIIGEPLTITNYQLTVPTGQQATNVAPTVTPRDHFGSYTPLTATVPGNIVVMSAGPSSTTTEEFFQDEDYRFPLTSNFDVLPLSLTGNFVSDTSLLDGSRTKELQVFDHTQAGYLNSLVHPKTDYTAIYPLGNPDYSPLAGSTLFSYARIYQATVDKSNGIISLPGLQDVDINSGLASNVLIDIKVPTKTVWLSLNKPFSLATFSSGADINTGSDGEGCRIDSGVYSPNINGQVRFTLGSFFTGTTTNRTLFIRVTYAHSGIARVLNGSGAGLSLVDW